MNPPGGMAPVGLFSTIVTYRRTFLPSSALLDRSPHNIIAPESPFSWIYCATYYSNSHTKFLDRTSIIISVDGACSGNGTPSASAGIGVYFGPGSPYNVSDRIGGAQTSQRAEICAAIRGLRVGAILRVMYDTNIRRIVIMSDSEYVVRGMTEWVYKWRRNGWKDAGGRRVVNAADFEELDELIKRLERDGIVVEFWKVDRSYNNEADALARKAC